MRPFETPIFYVCWLKAWIKREGVHFRGISEHADVDVDRNIVFLEMWFTFRLLLDHPMYSP